ncbi:PREDICTED: repetitive proline-rich cell wall protein-like [Trachymyrmex septentrionalis]|uniref:repetitive proline-rich cell wall protein-like n=1 Tax=Trachymyrmex septentrionalis TaxID=34720 RepID=UPI00084F2A9F|nr:PREDICTED: repetitive proline-rich cell wall protein-like [Trachymyrmex septentrionalis]
MFRLLIPCLLWLSTVRSETGMHIDMPVESLDKTSDVSMLKAKRDSIHQPCEPIHQPLYSHVPAYSPSPVYVKRPLVQPAYLKKELGIAPLAHLQYIQQPHAYPSVQKPTITYVKPATPVVNYHAQHQSLQYIKPVMPIYQSPIAPSYAPIYQKPLHYAPTYQSPIYHDVMPKIFLKKYETPAAQILYQKPLVHAPAIQYASPNVVNAQAPQVSYVKPLVHAPSPVYAPQPDHDSIIVKPHCA